jgi:hypothetical protein
MQALERLVMVGYQFEYLLWSMGFPQLRADVDGWLCLENLGIPMADR